MHLNLFLITTSLNLQQKCELCWFWSEVKWIQLTLCWCSARSVWLAVCCTRHTFRCTRSRVNHKLWFKFRVERECLYWALWARWPWSKPGWICLDLSTLNLLWVCSSRFVLQATVHFKLRKTDQNKPDQNITLSPLCFYSVAKWANLRQTSCLAEYIINACTHTSDIHFHCSVVKILHFTLWKWCTVNLLTDCQQGNSLNYSKG